MTVETRANVDHKHCRENSRLPSCSLDSTGIRALANTAGIPEIYKQKSAVKCMNAGIEVEWGVEGNE